MIDRKIILKIVSAKSRVQKKNYFSFPEKELFAGSKKYTNIPIKITRRS